MLALPQSWVCRIRTQLCWPFDRRVLDLAGQPVAVLEEQPGLEDALLWSLDGFAVVLLVSGRLLGELEHGLHHRQIFLLNEAYCNLIEGLKLVKSVKLVKLGRELFGV